MYTDFYRLFLIFNIINTPTVTNNTIPFKKRDKRLLCRKDGKYGN